MVRYFKKAKVKRILAWLLLVSTVLTTFITGTTETVSADSNSRRVTSINLAAGVGFGDIKNFNDIDEQSMQTIAIYLSNFYLPFITILDGDYTKEGAEDSGNAQHVQAMKDALIKNCGFNKAVAEYLVGYVLNQSLASCKTVYVRTQTLRDYFEKTQPFDKYEGYWYRETSKAESYLGFSNSGSYDSPSSVSSKAYWCDSSIKYSRQKITEGWGLGATTTYGEWDYITTVGSTVIDSVEYTPISYAIFMGMMNRTYPMIGSSWSDTYSTTITPKDAGYVEFFMLQSDSSGMRMAPVFSNNEACCLMLLHALQYCDLDNGFSNGFSSISSTDVEAIDDPELNQYALVSCPNVYVNWEGSLIYDNGVYRTVIIPGCMNPYMVTSCGNDEDGGIYTDVYPIINNTSISSIGMGVMTASTSVSYRSRCYYNYRVTIGSDQDKFDQSYLVGWGENEPLHNLLKSIEYVKVDATGGSADFARFPVLTERFTSVTNNKNSQFANTQSKPGGYVLDDIVWYDSLAPVTADTTLSKFFPTSIVYNLVDDLAKYNIDTYAQFKNIKKQGHSLTYPKSTQKLFQNIYLTYCFACFNSSSTIFKSDENIVNMKFRFENFPQPNIDIDWSSLQVDQLQQEVMSFVYYLLHPTEGVGYVANLFKRKVSGILLGWHEDVVGSSDSNASTGMTKYLGTSSYTTMPNLTDVSWISSILNIYNNIIVYLIILMCLILLCYVLTGSMTIQRGLVGVVLFGLCAFLPPVAINATVNAINTTSDAIYSKKFDFWAVCQMQNFVDDYVDAMEAQGGGNFTSYAAFVLSSTQSTSDGDMGGSSETSYSGVKLKWMAPKKYNSLASLVQAVNEGTAMGNSSASFLKNSLLTMVAKNSSGETYLDDTESLFLYRDYADIYRYAHTSYNILGTFDYGGNLGKATYSNWMLYGAPLWMGFGSSTNSYSRAWYNMEDSEAYKSFVETAVGVAIDDTAKSQTSSVSSISHGFLVNTIDYTVKAPGTKYNYLYSVSGGTTGTKNNTLATSYLADYTQTLREVRTGYSTLCKVVAGTANIQVGTPDGAYYNFGLTKATGDSTNSKGSYLWGYQEIIGLEDSTLEDDDTQARKIYKNLSDVTYGLYSESPFFFFNHNVRDQMNALSSYSYNFEQLNAGKVETVDASSKKGPNEVCKVFLQNNQEYFFNLESYAGDGYGELRDFTNMHDFFYFVIPYLREGVELARLYDDVFGLYVDEDCSLIVNADGSFEYDGQRYKDTKELGDALRAASGKYTDEELYKLWHSFNTYTILSAYTPWIDTMMDCDYAKSETIHVMGDKFKVSDPLNPMTYFETDSSDKIIAGRLMVFSRSEMNYYGLTTADLTTVERKIIEFQDNVYKETINLMNYYTFSNETIIQAYAMLQTFEFNKLFSQTSPIRTSYVMYPQGYELKAFSYDAYLRMIISNASGESLMYSGEGGVNTSIYERVMDNTSLFFGIFLLINDILAVYVIPGLKLFFLVIIFLCSILILIAAVVKMEMNIIGVLWKSLIAPLLSFCAVSMGMSLVVSMFMRGGANGVVTSEFIISVGDPTAALILMIILNSIVTILYFKICKKCFHDLITYGKATFDSIGGAFVGAVGAVGAGLMAGRAIDRFSSGGGGAGIARTAKQRGKDNDPRSGRNGIGVGGAAALAAAGAGVGMAAGSMGTNMAAGSAYDAMSSQDKKKFHDAQSRNEDSRGMNKYDKKAFDAANTRQDAAREKAERAGAMASNATGLKKMRLEAAQKLNQRRADSAQIKADNIKKYGNGMQAKVEGLKAMGGKGRASRLEAINKANDDRVKARESKARAALAERDKQKAQANAKANAAEMQRQTSYQQRRDAVQARRAANEQKKGAKAVDKSIARHQRKTAKSAPAGGSSGKVVNINAARRAKARAVNK